MPSSLNLSVTPSLSPPSCLFPPLHTSSHLFAPRPLPVRRILHFSPGPTDFVALLNDRAVAGAWFELHRQGGCGAGELRLKDDFTFRFNIGPGDWIAFEYTDSDRWYLGRVENVTATSPAGVTLRLEGMGVQLNEVFPGGFQADSDAAPPHRYANTDLFFNDPDYLQETLDSVDAPHDVVTLLCNQYVAPRTDISINPTLIEAADPPGRLTSLKFRGEESVRAALKDLAVRARNASWGVDQTGTFYFLRPRPTPLVTWREGRDLLSLEMTRDRDLLFNRVLLTGDYVYDAPINSDVATRGFYRWRGNYIQPASRTAYGEKRIRLWIPWIRTATDSKAFVSNFFQTYAQPLARYSIEVASTTLPRPWLGAVSLQNRDGDELITTQIETIRVQFDHTPRFRLELGAQDPRILWPEPPHDERWEIPANRQQISDPPTSSQLSSESASSSEDSSLDSSEVSSWASSDDSSALSSENSFDESTDESSEDSSDDSSDSSQLSSVVSDDSFDSSDNSFSDESSFDSSAQSSDASSDDPTSNGSITDPSSNGPDSSDAPDPTSNPHPPHSSNGLTSSDEPPTSNNSSG